MSTILQILVVLIIVLYIAALFFIVCYSVTQCNLMLRYLLYKKKYVAAQQPVKQFLDLPMVTVQLPVYNEKYVAGRLIDCIAQLDYPKDKLEIQVLDDSTDETTSLVAEKIVQLKSNLTIKHIRRTNRSGYKAGALKEGLALSSGELIAIFDADFLPAKDFLLKAVPYFADSNVGMVQTKWAWINKNSSFITKVQAFALDAHFSIEQVGRNIGNGFINFNGTAGIWRKACIIDAGNWQADTLTEDLDLSYRAQLKDWKFVYLEDVNAPSELPPVMSAVKTQQYRWNKGGAETARKHLRSVIFSHKSFSVKWHAAMHLLTSGVFLSAFSCAILSVPVLVISHYYPYYGSFLNLANYGFISFLLLGLMYLVATMTQYKSKWESIGVFLKTMPVFLALSMGLSLHNALAVLQGYRGKKSPFVRTPKFNITGQHNRWSSNQYLKKDFNKLTVAESGMMLYFAAGIFLAFQFHDFSLFIFHMFLAMGYGIVVWLTLFENGHQAVKKILTVESCKELLSLEG
ncbi:MAG: Glucomannan 4-beta-mannosyltransferase [Ferruginibacter sp.]|nr:Glucomannan 4-beta-mannosyltransferase [Ferruginibacter sp.]